MNVLFYIQRIIPGFDVLNRNIKFIGDQRQGLPLSNHVFEFANLIDLLSDGSSLGRCGVAFLEDL